MPCQSSRLGARWSTPSKSTRPGTPTPSPVDRQSCSVGLGARGDSWPDRSGEHGFRFSSRLSLTIVCPETDRAGEVHDATRDVIDVDLDAEPSRPLRIQAERTARPSNQTAFRGAFRLRAGHP